MEGLYYLPVKVMKNKRVEEFLAGNIYMNSLTYFRNLENPSQRDSYEGKFVADTNYDALFNRFPDDLKKVVKTFWYSNEENIPYFKLLCLYGLKVDCTQGIIQPNQRLAEFGDVVVVFKNYTEFKNRLIQSMSAKFGNKYYGDDQPIIYSPKHYNNSLADHLFTKREMYSWQNEIRMAVSIRDQMDEKPFQINIGNIKDIIEVMPISNFIKRSSFLSRRDYVIVQWDLKGLEDKNKQTLVNSNVRFKI